VGAVALKILFIPKYLNKKTTVRKWVKVKKI
jgi:hypothetical protein